MPTTQSAANADLATAAGLIQGALAFFEGPDTPLAPDQVAQVKTMHVHLFRIAKDAEVIAGVRAGTFAVQPLDGTPKPTS